MRFIYTKAFAIFSVCLIIVTIFVFFQTKGWVDPIRNTVLQSPRPVIILVKNITLPIKNFFSTLYQLNKITKENSDLLERVTQLQQNLVEYQQQARDNESLRKNLGFVQTTKLPLISCIVLSENAFGLINSLILNCGSDEGVTAGQAVVSQGYLVGKILYVGKNSSTVLLSTASDFSTDAKISQANTNAIVKGSFGSGLILEQVPQTADLQKGWLVVTAGINQQVPKNILIGQVSDILSGSNDLFKRAALTSPVDFGNLGFVFVVK
jgi:rod shape-determining protein MreC